MRLSKLHGLGNDFLILLDDGSSGPVAAERARALCARRIGIGADGLIRAEQLDAGAVTFELLNADGSAAEMSGNGARCLGLAAARAGWWEDRSRPLVLQTSVGKRELDWQGGDLAEASLRVGMGEVTPMGDLSKQGTEVGEPGAGARWTGWTVSVGNPHAVVLVDGPLPRPEELEAALTPAERAATADVNFELVARGPEAGTLTMLVRERGAGWTQACGTGSVAAAWAAYQHGWVGPLVTVHNPGGAVLVDLSEAEARLTGPAVHIATIEVEGGRP